MLSCDTRLGGYVVDLDRTKEAGVLHHLDPRKYFLLANTAGCYTAQDATTELPTMSRRSLDSPLPRWVNNIADYPNLSL